MTNSNVMPWGIEVELFNGRCVYLAANAVRTDNEEVRIKISDGNVISVPKNNIKKILLMCSNEPEETA